MDRGQVADFVFATVRGAAEFTKHRQEGPVRCAERDRCKRVREKERLLREEETDSRLRL